MNDRSCSYADTREELLVGYLYDDIGGAERAAFDAHVVTCAACRHELAELGAVRTQLGQWRPPEPRGILGLGTAAVPVRRIWWQEVPAWAQAVAAVLVLGVAAGAANLHVTYDRDGLSVRTGWSHSLTAPGADAPRSAIPVRSAAPADAAALPWRADLEALERQLRSELRANDTAAAAPRFAGAVTDDAALVARVRALIGESERRQQRELALRVADVVRDIRAERQADLVRIDRSLGLLENNTGVEVMRQRQMLNYLVRTAQTRD